MKQNYTFGDNERAAERLELLARVFEPTTRVLLVRALAFLSERPRRVLDVGSGPGATTRLLAEVLAPEQLLGIDKSERYVALARERLPGTYFVQHDVMRAPYPAGPHQLIYCRHVLTHLPDVASALVALRSGLALGGVLVLEETAFLRSSDAAFARYYQMVATMQEHYGQRMNIGALLPSLLEAAGFVSDLAAVTETAVDPAQMARLHALNLETWSRDPFAVAHFDSAELERLHAQLLGVAEGRQPAPPVEVGVAQFVVSGSG